MAKNAVATKEEFNVAIPDFMKEHMGLGTEGVSAADSEVPRIKLIQQLSPEIEQYEVKAGDFFHTLLERNLGPSVKVTPIFIGPPTFILWRPQETGGGILARADDGVHWLPANGAFDVKLKSGSTVTWRTAPTVAESGLDKWGSSNPADTSSPPAATRMYNVVIAFADYPDLPPAVVTLQRSAISVARRLVGKLKVTRAPSFGLVFDMSSITDTNNAGQKYYNYQFKAAGVVEDKDTYMQNHEMYEFFKKQGVQVKDLEGAQDDGIGDTAAPAGDGKGPTF